MSIAQSGQITLKQSVTIPSGLPANRTTYATLSKDPKSSTTSDEIQIPDGEAWIIRDVFISVAGDVADTDSDCYLVFEKNRREEKSTLGPLSIMLASNQQRPRLYPWLGWAAGEILRIAAINISAPAANRTNKFYMEVQKQYR